jgi:hypothetical protein
VTFKDLRRIIAEKNKEMEIEAKHYDPNCYWKGRKVVSLNEWLKIKNKYGLNAALQYYNISQTTFPDLDLHSFYLVWRIKHCNRKLIDGVQTS